MKKGIIIIKMKIFRLLKFMIFGGDDMLKHKGTIIVCIFLALQLFLLCQYNRSNAKTIKLSKKSVYLVVGQRYKLRVSGKPISLKWKTSNKKIATVNKKGIVHAKKKGKAKITVAIKGSKKATKQKKLICKVTVLKKKKYRSNPIKNEDNKVQTKEQILLKPIQYQTHIQDYGWKELVSDGEVSGTTGKAKRMEALKIVLVDNNGKSVISYRTHCSNKGWLRWCKSGEVSGTTGENRPIEAVEIKLENQYKDKYDIYYRIHVETLGWLGWAKNGETSGTVGCGAQGEAIQIKVCKKDKKFNVGTIPHYYSLPQISYKTHVQDYGWTSLSNNGNTSGSTGKAKRMEAIVINLKDNFLGDMVSYSTHLSDIGWTKNVNSGAVSGTTGQNRAIEAIKIQLKGKASELFDIYYRVHVQNLGWLGWTRNDGYAGTTAGAVPVEAIQIKLYYKGDAAAPTIGNSYKDLTPQPQPPQTNQYDSKVQGFINDARWKEGIAWGNGQTPKLSGWSSQGCCAYVADFTKYVFDKNNQKSGVLFTNPNDIRSGDVIWTGGHWFVILYRNGNQLTTAEGNYAGKVRITSSGYTVGSFSIKQGYHYQ